MPTITLSDPVPGTVVASGLIATDNANLRTLLNGGLDGANLLGSPALATGEFPVWNGTQFVRSSTINAIGTVPAGCVFYTAGSTAPSGYNFADGSSQLRVGAGFDALFAVIGTTYGAVDGSHFTLPDIQGRIVVTKGSNASVNTLGQNDGQSLANRRPHHRTSNALTGSYSGTTATENQAHYHGPNGGGGSTVFLTNSGTNFGLFAGGSFAINSENNTSIELQNHNHNYSGSVSFGGSIGSNVGTDAIDTPSFIVLNAIIKL